MSTASEVVLTEICNQDSSLNGALPLLVQKGTFLPWTVSVFCGLQIPAVTHVCFADQKT